MAQSWQRLVLWLRSYIENHSRTSCNTLPRLGLLIDVIDVLIQHKHSTNMPHKNTYIDTLGLGDSVINNPQDIAAFLACPGCVLSLFGSIGSQMMTSRMRCGERWRWLWKVRGDFICANSQFQLMLYMAKSSGEPCLLSDRNERGPVRVYYALQRFIYLARSANSKNMQSAYKIGHLRRPVCQ